jgi:crossover junction endodeoxyribonuclease RuvC
VRVLGIDPGSRLTGWGVVEEHGRALRYLGSGTMVLQGRGELAVRLARLGEECGQLLSTWRPAAVVLERAFVARNVQSALRLGEARGAVLAAVGATGIALHEYAPAAVKLAAVGHGQADKGAIIRGVGQRLGLAAPLATDAADALALALCHLQHAPLLAALDRGARRATVVSGPRSAPARRGSL